MKVRLLKKGPLQIDGDIPIKEVLMVMDDSGKVTEFQERKTFGPTENPKHICRCGRSDNMPYCDGRHSQVGFDAPETTDKEAYNAAAETIDNSAEKAVSLLQSAKRLGPVGVSGGVQIVGEDGFEYAPKMQAAICRCGQSKNMPFCDGAHVHAEHMVIK